MDVEIVSIEAWRPVSVATLRANLRRTDTSEDTLFQGYLDAAVRLVEQRTKRSLLGRRYDLFLPLWPGTVELPWPPLRYAVNADPDTAVTVAYRNDVGAYVAAPADAYRLYREPQVWNLRRGAAALPAAADHPRAMRIRVDVGYRDAAHMAAEAPDLIDAIILWASHRDQNREATLREPRVMEISRKVELGFDDLIRPYVVATRYRALWSAE